MPELPEIETLKKSLEPKLINRVLINIEILREKIRYNLNSELLNKLNNIKIISLMRRAKYLIINLSNQHSLIIHLGMSGKFFLEAADTVRTKHDHVIFHLDQFEKLVFNDVRRFGMIYIYPTDNLATQKIFKDLSMEPLSQQFNDDYLLKRFLNKKSPIKNAIMNNQLVVGVGNIYASEALYQAKINPFKLASNLAKSEINLLISAIKEILQQAIIAKGTTLKDFVDGYKNAGKYKHSLKVYGRENQLCDQCNSVILRKKQSGRSTFYCSECQK